MGDQPSTCPACQAALAEGGKFCGYCGFRLSAISEAKHQALAEQIRTSSDTLDPLPALSGQADADVEGDTRADVFADTFAAGGHAEAAPAKIHAKYGDRLLPTNPSGSMTEKTIPRGLSRKGRIRARIRGFSTNRAVWSIRPAIP